MLNTNGIKSNLNYLNKISLQYGIIILLETMCIRTNSIKQAFKNNNQLNFYNKKAVKTEKRGRGSDGITFIVNKKLKSNAYFPCDRIGVLLVENLAIISAYMPYYKPNNQDQLDLYSSELDKLKKIYLDLKSKQYEIIICGDFNVDNFDPDNHNEMTEMYIKMTNELKLNHVDTETPQTINYTFKTALTWLDHVLCENQMVEKINVLIKEDYDSKSDHFPLIIHTNYTLRKIGIVESKKQFEFLPKHILKSMIFKTTFQSSTNAKFLQLKTSINLLLRSNKNDQEIIDDMCKELYESLNASILLAKNTRCSDPKYKYVRSNSWWSDRAQSQRNAHKTEFQFQT